MPNQLSTQKRRKSIAEHAVVLDALDLLAKREGTTSTEMIRQSLRGLIRDQAKDPETREALAAVFRSQVQPWNCESLASPAKLSRMKRRQREYDALVLDLGLSGAEELQSKNSLHKSTLRPRLVAGL